MCKEKKGLGGGGVLSDLDPDITDLLDSLKCNLADGQKHDVPEVS